MRDKWPIRPLSYVGARRRTQQDWINEKKWKRRPAQFGYMISRQKRCRADYGHKRQASSRSGTCRPRFAAGSNRRRASPPRTTSGAMSCTDTRREKPPREYYREREVAARVGRPWRSGCGVGGALRRAFADAVPLLCTDADATTKGGADRCGPSFAYGNSLGTPLASCSPPQKLQPVRRAPWSASVGLCVGPVPLHKQREPLTDAPQGH